MKEKKRYLALGVAALACPCHIALVSALAAGTALGASLEAYRGWFFAGAALVFLAALMAAFWEPRQKASASCDGDRCRSGGRDPRDLADSQAHEREESWQAAVR